MILHVWKTIAKRKHNVTVLSKAAAEGQQRPVLISPNVVRHHSIDLISCQKQLGVIQGETGTLTGTVLDVMSLIQHYNLLLQINFHLAKKQRDCYHIKRL